MAASGAAAAFCPTSNFFLGSGAFDYAASTAAGLRVGLATDVGGGTGFSLIRTLGEAYEASQIHGTPLSAMRGWYLATLGGARALYLDDHIGNFQPGHEADFTVLDPRATPLLERRSAACATLEERLFVLMMLGDDRAVAATHLMGVPA
jgi:guanine deaminase